MAEYDEDMTRAKMTVFQMYFSGLVVYCRTPGKFLVNDTGFFERLLGVRNSAMSVFRRILSGKKNNLPLLEDVRLDIIALKDALATVDDKWLTASRADTEMQLDKMESLFRSFRTDTSV